MKIIASVLTAALFAVLALMAPPAQAAPPDGCYITLKVRQPVGGTVKLTKADLRKVRACAQANRDGGILDVLINPDSGSLTRYFGDLVVEAFVKTGRCALIKGAGSYQANNCNVNYAMEDPSGQTPAFTVTVLTEH